jgi:hypothetical protein
MEKFRLVIDITTPNALGTKYIDQDIREAIAGILDNYINVTIKVSEMQLRETDATEETDT